MANDTPELTPIEESEWEKEFQELTRQVSEREIFANVWFRHDHLVRTIVSRLRVDGSVIHLYLPQAKRRDGFCAEIVIQPRDEEIRDFQFCKSQSGEVFLWMQQDGAVLELSNSWEFLQRVANYPPLQ